MPPTYRVKEETLVKKRRRPPERVVVGAGLEYVRERVNRAGVLFE